MCRLRALWALHGIVLVVASTVLLAACDRSTPTYATFDIEPVTMQSVTTDTTAVTTIAARPSTTAPPEAATTTALTTTTTFRIVTNTAPQVTAAPARANPSTTTTLPPATSTTVTTSTTVVASQGWVTVLASLSTANYSRAAAADWRIELGVGEAELLLSDDYSSLTPGYWVLYRGPYRDRASAASVCAQYADRVTGCYPAPLTLAASS